jgi:hypothetical protein
MVTKEQTASTSEAGQPITPAQAEARRRNGAKSQGPMTDPGKEASRRNALKHGAYGKTVGMVTRGPLLEDEEEAEAFCEMVIEGLGPDTPLEQLLAQDVAASM